MLSKAIHNFVFHVPNVPTNSIMIAFLIETTHNLVNTLLHFGEGIMLETSTLETLYW